ncbi:hypothetical protein [Microlunatus parietis]|uniref:Immunity protein 52 n=1 Tax=Microlunatus parietis TaxID=682979 RepID=A0A7Y9I503_9ACTN|nr:hypothetical protein [Microlunatus parietis]NYE70287.1 hypothetical protein [Microlunatus parietis]
MDKPLIVRGFWGPRPESAERITDRLLAFLALLDEVGDERLGWTSHRLPGASLAEPENARRVIDDAFRRNTDAPHLGITQTFEACGHGIEQLSITMSVGGYSDSPKVRNGIVVTWQRDDAAAPAGSILCHLVSVWEPDWAAVTSRSLLRELADVQPVGTPTPKLGYLSYLSAARAVALPDEFGPHLARLEDGGVMINSGEGAGFLPVETIRELAGMLNDHPAARPVPDRPRRTDRSC